MNTLDGRVVLAVAIPADWLDPRDNLAAAFYTAAFDLGIDALKQVIGVDEAYRLATRRSTVALEAHVVMLGTVPAGSIVQVSNRIADHDAKRLHIAQEMHLGDRLVATRECMTISFDLDARRTCAFETAVQARILALHDAQRTLPPHVGRAHLLGITAAVSC